MSFNVKTKTEFALDVDAQRAAITVDSWEEMNTKRNAWVEAAVEAGKTDSVVSVEPGIRNWKDAASANEFKQLLEGLGKEYNLEVTVTIL